MHCVRTICVTVAVGALHLCNVNAAPVKPLDIALLAERADVIVIGQLSALGAQLPATVDTADGPLPAIRSTASFRVETMLKGSAPPQGLSFEIISTRVPAGLKDVAV